MASTDAAGPLAGYGGSGGGGCGRGGNLAGSRSGKPDPREVHRDARLPAGTTIFATNRGKGAWGVLHTDVVSRIDMHADDDFGRVGTLPGISDTVGCDCEGLDAHAWVARADVQPAR